MRTAGVDVGLKRIGLALSDASGTLASPWKTLASSGDPERDARSIAAALAEILDEPVETIVVGHPRRLDGTPTDLTSHVEALATALRRRIAMPVVLQDERLTSQEAESRLALREKDWRARKRKLDAAAAAVLLQDYLDRPRPDTP